MIITTTPGIEGKIITRYCGRGKEGRRRRRCRHRLRGGWAKRKHADGQREWNCCRHVLVRGTFIDREVRSGLWICRV